MPFKCVNLRVESADLVSNSSFVLNRQPGKALPYFIKLRRPEVFDLIREFNLFTDVQDQALRLIEFDQDLQRERKESEAETEIVGAEASLPRHGVAIDLLVDHTHSIPVSPLNLLKCTYLINSMF